MLRTLLLFGLTVTAHLLPAQELTVQTFGEPSHPAVVFLHGGPGYNSVAFERLTAARLAEQELFVISYDRRGEGRNADLEADYTFAQTKKDLLALYARFRLDDATLLGHSFGGVVGTLFAEEHPEKVRSLVLVGAPLSLPETLTGIVARCKALYTEREDQTNLGYIALLEKMDSTSLMYSSYTFAHAMQNGFYVTPNPNELARELYARYGTDSLLLKYSGSLGFAAPVGFHNNEAYTSLTLRASLRKVMGLGVPVYGLYGKEDGLYGVGQVRKLRSLLGEERFRYLDNCSHNVFIDRRETFVNAVKTWSEADD